MADASVTSIVPVHNRDAERAVITAALSGSIGFDYVVDIVNAEDFYLDCNRRIWDAVCDLDNNHVRVDAITVASKLRETGRLQQVGGVAYLSELTDCSPDIGHVSDHAHIVADYARQRRIVAACRTGAATGLVEIEDVEKYAQSVAESVYLATDVGTSRDKPETLQQLIPTVFRAIGDRSKEGFVNKLCVTTGWLTLNNKLSGGWTNNLYVVAGRPGMGKTAFALSACVGVAEAGRSAVIVSAEMPKEQLVLRLLSQKSGIKYETLAKGEVAGGDWPGLTQAAAELAKLPISIAYRPGATVPEIRSLIRRETARLCSVSKIPRGIACIDYLQILNGQRVRGDSRENEVSEMSRRFMAMTGEFEMPILLLSQLNREVEKRPNKRPCLSDLRDSGSIEQDAYGVLFLYRDGYYNENSDDQFTTEVDVAKHRNGATGVVKMHFKPETMKFSEIDGYYDDDAGYDN